MCRERTAGGHHPGRRWRPDDRKPARPAGTDSSATSRSDAARFVTSAGSSAVLNSCYPGAVRKVNILPFAASYHDFEPVRPRFAVIPEEGFPRCGASIQHAEHVHPVANLGPAGGVGGNGEEIGQTNEVVSPNVPRQAVRPAYQEGHACRDVEETLLLPRGMIPEVVAVVREEADDRVVGVLAGLDGVQKPTQAIVDIGDLSVVTGLEHAGQRIVDFIRPDDPVHEGNLLVQVVHVLVAAHGPRHAVGVVDPVEGHGRREGRMGTNEGHETEIRPVIGRAQRLDRAVRGPGLHGQVGGQRACLGHVVHLGPLPHERLDIVEIRMLAGDPARVGVSAPLLLASVEFLAVELGRITHVLVPREGVELPHAEGPVARGR